MKVYKYGILSTASIVPRFINALRESGRGEVVAIASRSEEKAAEKAKEWNIPKSYGSYEALLADPEVEVVYVAMINSEHYTYTLKALEAGKHVICEKPFTLNHEHARHLFQVAREKGSVRGRGPKGGVPPGHGGYQGAHPQRQAGENSVHGLHQLLLRRL